MSPLRTPDTEEELMGRHESFAGSVVGGLNPASGVFLFTYILSSSKRTCVAEPAIRDSGKVTL